MSSAPIYIERKDDIGSIILNRTEKKNALTQAMWEAIPTLVAELDADKNVKVIVLKSADLTVFSAGADITEFEQIAKDAALREKSRIAIREAQRSLARMSKPTLAMISGPCVGGGCGLALACDIRIAADTARMGITPSKLGIVYSLQDSKQLTDVVGPSHAKSILYTGRLVGAAEALRIGLVNDVHPLAELDEATTAFALSIAENSQWSVRGIKHVIRQILDGETDDTPETEAMFSGSFEGIDHKEGVTAFLARRKPVFPFR